MSEHLALTVTAAPWPEVTLAWVQFA